MLSYPSSSGGEVIVFAFTVHDCFYCLLFIHSAWNHNGKYFGNNISIIIGAGAILLY